jgi:transposase
VTAKQTLFLLDPEVSTTNHQAEQALKTPIVNRKVWVGNRTEAGAEAQGVNCSVIQTCKTVASDAVGTVSQAIRSILTSLFPTNTPLLAKQIQSLAATRFYEGASGRNYIDASLFDRAGFRLGLSGLRPPDG